MKYQNSDIVNKISMQITRIEQIIEDLLTDIDMEDMSTYERLSLVPRFLLQQQRAIEIQQTLIITEPEQRESILINTLIGQMRSTSIESDEDEQND